MNDDDLKKLALLMARKWGAREAIERFTYMGKTSVISRATAIKLVAMCESDHRNRLTRWELSDATGAGR